MTSCALASTLACWFHSIQTSNRHPAVLAARVRVFLTQFLTEAVTLSMVGRLISVWAGIVGSSGTASTAASGSFSLRRHRHGPDVRHDGWHHVLLAASP
jgi:hypothetical protein